MSCWWFLQADTNDVLKELMEGPLLNKALPTMTEGFPNKPVDEGDVCIATSEENVGSSVDYDGTSLHTRVCRAVYTHTL